MMVVLFFCLVGGVIVLGKVWGKKRPVIVSESESGTEFYFGISHSEKRKNMKPLTPVGIEGLEIHDNTFYGLCNKPAEMGDPFGTVTSEKDKELIDSLPEKKKEKREKRA